MKVVDIHPEELIDKLSDGSLTSAERQRLHVHLAQCSSCRFEVAVRADVARDAPPIEQRPQLTFAASSGDAAAERTYEAPHDRPPLRVSRSIRPRSRRRWLLTLLAASLVLSAGGAMAAVITGAVGRHWLGRAPDPKSADSSVHVSNAKPTKLKRTATSAASPVAVVPDASVAAPSAVPSLPTTVPAPRVAVSASVRAALPARGSDVAPGEADRARASAVDTLPAPPVTVGSTDASAKRVDAASLFADANRARRDGNADQAVSLYRTLQSRYPSSSESELSRALLAQLLLDRGNPEAALAGFDRYLVEGGAPVLSAEALVGRARALEQLGRSTQAAAAWRQVQSRFPGSVHARLAATRLAALGMR